MFVLFDDASQFGAGRLLDETETSLQVELDSGKRVKVKTALVMLRFDRPEPSLFLQQAQQEAQNLDLSLAWEFAPDEEFGFVDLARDYYGSQAGLVQQAAALFALFNAPHYFRRAGHGRFRKASAEVLAQALAAIERKKKVVAQIDEWANALCAGHCPPDVESQLYAILFKPDKNSPAYKAVLQACKQSQQSPLHVLQQAGAIRSPYQFHWKRFVLEHFPKGSAWGVAGNDSSAAMPSPQLDDLPVAPVQAFSIDDSNTTEIDDALSLSGLGTGSVRLGIHIAVPTLGVQMGDALDNLARSRLSTVYLPGHKITMLPEAVVAQYSLREGQTCPALSLYLQIDEAGLDIQAQETRLERVPIAANLRHDQLDEWVTASWLQTPTNGHHDAPVQAAGLGQDAEWGGQATLAFLYRLAQHCKARREVVRGKPEIFKYPDYSFKLLDRQGDEPTGEESIHIHPRQRGAPLDLIVAEAMILANSHWGQWLASLGVPGIYRSQASLTPGVKVRMGTKPLPHAGIGVPCYAWSTSPLRRYVDWVNQSQLLACVRHHSTAALAAPFKPKDVSLLSIISAFDSAYSAYNDFQSSMERYWTLRHLQQTDVSEFTATVVRDQVQPLLARADDWPLVLSVAADATHPKLCKGKKLRLRLQSVDLLQLEAQVQCVQVLDDPSPNSANEDANDAEPTDAEPEEFKTQPVHDDLCDASDPC